MTSINREKPEKNLDNLFGEEAVHKIKELVAKAKTCLFCTNIKTGQTFSTRPMSVQQLDDNGVAWFLSASDSSQNAEISRDSHVQLLFQGSSYSDFLTLSGQATLSRDKAKIKELWQPILKDWFTGGIDDPRVTVISVRPSDGYYWDLKHGMAVAFVKKIVGAVTGKTLDDSIEGKLKP